MAKSFAWPMYAMVVLVAGLVVSNLFIAVITFTFARVRDEQVPRDAHRHRRSVSHSGEVLSAASRRAPSQRRTQSPRTATSASTMARSRLP
jgi:hypothetical protein